MCSKSDRGCFTLFLSFPERLIEYAKIDFINEETQVKRKDHFERNWMIIFIISYLLIMLPLPFYYSTKYIPGPWGVPLFIFGWLIHGAIVMLLIVIYAVQCMKRPEYKNFDADTQQSVQE